MEKRGIRNNNPGNIKRGEPWLGLRVTQTDTEFCQFCSDMWGIRAMIIIIRTYVYKYNLRYVKEIISRWAPTNENDTAAYVKFVEAFMKTAGSNPTQPFYKLDFKPKFVKGAYQYTEGFYRLFWMVSAMCIMESDYQLKFDIFRTAYNLTLSKTNSLK